MTTTLAANRITPVRETQYLAIDTDRVDPATSAAQTSTATVTINVTGS